MNFYFKSASFTNVGGRTVNEDSLEILENKENNCYILCDGLGGHGMGDAASSLVVNTFKEQFTFVHFEPTIN